MKRQIGPFASVHELKRMDANVMPPMQSSFSGEITTDSDNGVMGAVNAGGRVSNVWMSVAASGKDDTNPLSIAVDVRINGTTCLTTQPFISHVSGEASTQKTTIITGETGIRQAVINSSANTFAPGDIISRVFDLTRTATPTTEISNPVVVVELEPNIL